MQRRTLLQFPGAALAAQAPARAEDVIELGGKRELFVDRHLIASMQGAELRLQRPIEREMVLHFDRPWEGAFCGYSTIIKDGADFHLYYRGIPDAGSDGRSAEVTCYAHSSDGIHWTRPTLGLFEVRGTRDNNVIYANDPPFSHNFCPFLDRKPGVPAAERFKAIGGTMKSGLAGFVSADGVHWKKLRAEPVLPPQTRAAYDSQNLAFWSEAENCYVAYYRVFRRFPNMGGIRWIARATSADFRTWSEGKEMEFGDAPPEHLYTNQTSPYYRAPHIYVSIAARFMPGRQVVSDGEAKAIGVHPQYYKDCADGVMLTTRGGLNYDRTFMEGFLRPGVGLENWVSRDNYPALNVVETGPQEMSFYVNRHYGQPTSHLSRYTLRLDGFASLTAPYRGGEATTKLLRFMGTNLELNYATSAAGLVRVELLSAAGEKLAESRELIGDRIARTVLWPGRTDLAEWQGKPVRLRFRMKDAELYSLRFTA